MTLKVALLFNGAQRFLFRLTLLFVLGATVSMYSANAFGATRDLGTPPRISAEERQKAAEFYQGKTISVVTAMGPGDAGDVMLRVFLKYLPQYLPGNPRMGTITYMRGGAGSIAANYVWERARRDGTLLGHLTGVEQLQFESHKAVRYDLRKMNWIANVLPPGENIVYTRAGAGLDTVQDLLKAKAVHMSGIAVGHTQYIQLRVGSYFLGIPFNIITGYSRQETQLAMERGEVDGRVQTARAFLEGENQRGKFKVHWTYDRQRGTVLPNVPTLLEVIDDLKIGLNDRERKFLHMLPTITRYSRYFGMPPDVPRERVLAVREGFYRTMSDPKFQAEFEKVTGWPVDYTDGDQLLKDFVDLIDAPPEDVSLYKLLAGPTTLPRRK